MEAILSAVGKRNWSRKLPGGLRFIWTSLSSQGHLRNIISTYRVNLAILFGSLFLALSTTPSRVCLYIWSFTVLWTAYLFRACLQEHPFPKHIKKVFLEPEQEKFEDWWLDPKDLSNEELGLVRYIESITCGLPKAERERVWAMKGGDNDVEQLGFTSVRYHLAFTAYSISFALQRTPAYVGRTRRILEDLLDHLLQHRVWKFMDFYWKGDELHPFTCTENVMWSGHVLQMATTIEALTGSGKFLSSGSISTRDDISGKVYKTDAIELAETIAGAMDVNAVGGMPCEPGLVFFQCNNHPMIGFRMLESFSREGGRILGRSGDLPFEKQRARWERYALNAMKAPIENAAMKILVAADKKKSRGSSPFGHLGGDGWSLGYYFAWTANSRIPRLMYEQITRPFFRRCDVLSKPPPDGPVAAAPNSCCFAMNIPASAWVVQLSTVAAQSGDIDAVGAMLGWMRKHYRVSDPASGRIWLREHMEWAIGNTANFLISLSVALGGSSLRRLALAPPPKSYFQGAVIENIQPSSLHVFRARRCDHDNKRSTLYLGVTEAVEELMPTGVRSPGCLIEIYLRNVKTVNDVTGEGVDPSSIKYDEEAGVLEVHLLPLIGDLYDSHDEEMLSPGEGAMQWTQRRVIEIEVSST